MRSALLPLLLVACNPSEPIPPLPPNAEEPALATPRMPMGGVAEGDLDAPVGSPLGGYTGRCTCLLGGDGEIDGRDTAYTEAFNPSVGMQIRPTVKALWLENGVEDLVLLKTDAIFATEVLHREVARILEEETGRELEGKVVLTTTHSHAAPGGWDPGLTWYLAFDQYNEELFQRTVQAMVRVALQAWESREPVNIGFGQARDWDPENRVYSDRRGENDSIQFFEDIPAGSYKDPNLSLLRVDRAIDGSPLGVFFAFGMHGTTLDADNQMMSSEAGGHVELALEERFPAQTVVAYMQHGGGDASPRGRDEGFARLETIGALAVPAIEQLWAETPTSNRPLRIETVTLGIDSSRDVIRVHRPYGELSYAPYNPDPGFVSDQQVWDAEGQLISPIDEFNTESGAAFCGGEGALPLSGNLGADVAAYSSCVKVETLMPIIGGFFGLSAAEVELPLPESTTITASMSRLGPVLIKEPDGTRVEDDLLLGFFPGETTAVFAEQFRRRAADELGFQHAIPIGYAQDHMGYMLTPEDWLAGGYEPNINLWGPLQGEHVMEQMLGMAETWLLNEEIEPPETYRDHPDAAYDIDRSLPELEPDLTPQAGTPLEAVPEGLVVPIEGLEPAVAPPAQVRRVQDIVQLVWQGGDPAVDIPVVMLQRLEGGSWSDVTTMSGRAVSDTRADILLATTPAPTGPAEASQVHAWWAAWQVIGTDHFRAGLPLGTYRLRVEGHRYAGGARTWPWPAESYSFESEPFEVMAAELSLAPGEDGSLLAWIPAHPQGYRMVDLDGQSRGANPVREARVTWELADGSTIEEEPEADVLDGISHLWISRPAGAVAVEVVDRWGNLGRLSL